MEEDMQMPLDEQMVTQEVEQSDMTSNEAAASLAYATGLQDKLMGISPESPEMAQGEAQGEETTEDKGQEKEADIEALVDAKVEEKMSELREELTSALAEEETSEEDGQEDED